MTVRQLLENTTSVELSEWAAYFKIRNERMEKKQDTNVMAENIKHSMIGYAETKKARKKK